MKARAVQILLLLSSLVAASTALAQVPFQRIERIPPRHSQAVQLSSAETQVELKKISEFLKTLPLIRLHIVEAPGHGHQVANVNAMVRLRELGFTGRLQALYSDSVAIQLSNMIPRFDPTKKTQQTHSVQLQSIEWIADSVAKNQIGRERVLLAIQGAHDGSVSHSLMAQLNAANVLQLQPRHWNHRGSTREILLETHESISLEHLHNLGIVTADHKIENWNTFLSEQLAQSPQFLLRQPFLQTLMENRAQLDLLPAYGIDYPFDPGKTIELVVSALRVAVAERSDLFTKPIVIPVFAGFEDENKNALFLEKLKALEVEHLSAENSEASERLTQLRPGEILVVHVGPMPTEVFDAIFKRATLPALLLGKNLTSMLLNQGLPFLNVIGSTFGLAPLRAQLSSSERQLVESAFMALDSRSSREMQTSKPIARYFIDIQYPQSSLRVAFQAAKADAKSLNSDLMGQALIELIHAFEIRKLKPSALCAELL